MAPKRKASDTSNSIIPKRIRHVLPLSEKVKILDLVRIEKKSYAEVAKIYGKNESSIREIVKKENQIRTNFALAPQTAKFTARVRDKSLVKMENELTLWVEDMNRRCVPIDGNMLRQKALSLYEEISKTFADMKQSKLFTASKGWLHRFRNRLHQKNINITGEASSDNEEAASFPLNDNKLNHSELTSKDHNEVHRDILTNQYLEVLIDPSTDEEEENEKITESANWTLSRFEEVFQIAQILKDRIMEYEPDRECSFRVTRMITEGLQPIRQQYDNLKKGRKSSPKRSSTIDHPQPSTSYDIQIKQRLLN